MENRQSILFKQSELVSNSVEKKCYYHLFMYNYTDTHQMNPLFPMC